MSSEKLDFLSFWEDSPLSSIAQERDVDQTVTPQTIAQETSASLSGAGQEGATYSEGSLPSGEQAGLDAALSTLPSLSLAELDALQGAGEASVVSEPSGVASEGGLEEISLSGVDFAIKGVLGEGGMGRVELALQTSLHREVALKRPKPHLGDESVKFHLFREGMLTGALEHPNIIPVHILGCDEAGYPVLVMKRVEGISWRDLLRDPAHPAWERLKSWSKDVQTRHLEILMEVASAAHFAHQKGIVHRDIKVSNVMIGEFGEVYLIDWGIAVLIEEIEQGRAASGSIEETGDASSSRVSSSSPAVAGTPSCMAPEMLEQPLQLDVRTDVYLLGATLHEVLTGATRHKGATLHDVLQSAHESRPFAYDASVPVELAAICNKAMHADPAQRHPDALAFREAISDFLQHQQSIRLAALAHESLSQLQSVLQALPAEPSAEEHIHLRRLFNECRFGFRLALREWAENPRAQSGLQACLETMFQVEIAQKNLANASALLAEISSPSFALTARIEELRDSLQREKQDNQRLRALESSLDQSVSRVPRILFGSLFTLLSGGISLVATWLHSQGRFSFSHRNSFTLASVIFVAFVIGLFFARKTLFVNAIYRRFFALIFFCFLSVLSSRLLCMVAGISIERAVVFDCLLLGTFAAVFGVMLHRGFHSGFVLALGLAFYAAYVPQHAIGVLTFVSAAIWFLLVIIWVMQPQQSSS